MVVSLLKDHGRTEMLLTDTASRQWNHEPASCTEQLPKVKRRSGNKKQRKDYTASDCRVVVIEGEYGSSARVRISSMKKGHDG